MAEISIPRTARSEVEPSPHTIAIGEETFTLPGAPPLPLDLDEAVASKSLAAVFRMYLGEEQYQRLRAMKLDRAELRALDAAIGDLYGFGNTGESGASGGSSPSTSSPSRPTSSPATGSTSDGSSSDQPQRVPAASGH